MLFGCSTPQRIEKDVFKSTVKSVSKEIHIAKENSKIKTKIKSNQNGVYISQFPHSDSEKLSESMRYMTGTTLDRLGFHSLSLTLNRTTYQIEQDIIIPLDNFRTFKYRGFTAKLQPPKVDTSLDKIYWSFTIDF